MTVAITQQLFDLEYGRSVLQSASAALGEVVDKLQVPPLAEVLSAGQTAAQDSARAIQSSSYLIFLIGQPVARLLGCVVYWIGWFIYKYILVEGMYNHGLSQTKEIALMYWKWQSSLTREQLMYEAAAVVTVFGLYRLYKFLERKKYHRRLAIWMDRKKRQIEKTYCDGVRRIARVSLVLAAMTSHMLFLACSATIRFLFPRLVAVFANQKFISLFSFWCPLLFTVSTVFQYKEDKLEEERAKGEQSSNRRLSYGRTPSRRRYSISNRSRRGSFGFSKQSAEQSVSSPDASLENELRDWLRFWMVRGCLEAVKSLLGWCTPSWIISTTLELELLFYVWVYCLPMIQPRTIAGQTLPEGRPLHVICSILGPYSQQFVDRISGAVPEQFWQNHVVAYAAQVAALLKLVRLLKQSTADWLLHVIQEGRGLFIPALTLMTPGMLTRYGVVYVQFVLPSAKSYSRQRNTDATLLWLQYWVIHAGVDAVLSYFSSLLWWVPFSTHAIFCLWCYLSLPQTIKNWYNLLESELKLLGILPGDHEGDIELTNTARLLMWIWEILPKAKDDENGEKEEKQNNEGDRASQENQVTVMANTTGVEVATSEGEDQVSPLSSPLPKERGVEERSPSSSPKMLVSVDTCTTTTTEDGDEYEMSPRDHDDELADILDRDDDNDEDIVDDDDDDGKAENDDDGNKNNNQDEHSDDGSDVAVIDFDFQEVVAEGAVEETVKPHSTPTHPMMTRSAARRRAQQQYRPIDVIRD